METLLESALVLRALVVIGGFTVLFYCCKFTWKCWRGFRVYVLSEYWRADLRAYGQWAVVTGATSGIGKAYAMELASRGLDVVLVSRSEGKLQAVAKEIESMYGRQTRIIQTDFTEGPQIYPRIAEKLQGLEIGILVNNVGMNYAGMLVSFLDVPDPEQRITQVINCNILSVTQVSVPGCKGLIINVSSEAASAPQPLLTLYSATKVSSSFLLTAFNSLWVFGPAGRPCCAPEVLFIFLGCEIVSIGVRDCAAIFLPTWESMCDSPSAHYALALSSEIHDILTQRSSSDLVEIQNGTPDQHVLSTIGETSVPYQC
uniref:Hydroxysteroid (20-beta) dehydrogenase 2 n=1 Tax=Paramormyrops kingsleyae TaxID=1676925 RepID=A0A3B3RMA3_9TELE